VEPFHDGLQFNNSVQHNHKQRHIGIQRAPRGGARTDLFQGRGSAALGGGGVPPDGPGRGSGGGEVVVVLDVGPGLGGQRRGRPVQLRLGRLLPLGARLVRRRLLLLLLERLERREHVAGADLRLLRSPGAPAPSSRHPLRFRYGERERKQNPILSPTLLPASPARSATRWRRRAVGEGGGDAG
jgi:hypothetical protein